MSASTIPVAKAQLIDTIKGASWPTGVKVTVCYGEPKDFPRVAVVVGDTFGTGDNVQTWAGLGDRNREERYTFGLTVRVDGKGQTQQQSTELAFAIFSALSAELRTFVALEADDPPALWQAEVMGAQHIEVPTNEGYMAQIVSGVRCMARI